MEVIVSVLPDNQEQGKYNVEINFPKDQPRVPVGNVVHVLCSAISLLVRSCANDKSEIKDHELMKEVMEHLNVEFGSTNSFNDIMIDSEILSHKKLNLNHCEECSKELEKGSVFCSADCRIHYYKD